MNQELVGQGIPFDPIESIEEPLKQPSLEPKTSRSKKGPDSKKPQKKGSPVITILLVILTIAALSAAVFLYIAKEDESSLRIDAEKKIEELTMAKLEVEKELQDTLLVKRQLESDIEQGRVNLANLLADFQQEKQGHASLKKQYEAKLQTISSLRARLEKEENVSVKMSTKLIKVSREYNDLRTQLRQIRMAKEALENRMLEMNRKQANESVKLETIVVKEDNTATNTPPAMTQAPATSAEQPAIVRLGPPAKLEGQVLVVNKEFSFVVINLGEKDGLEDSAVLDVYRGRELLGKVQVERIYDTMSSAVILPRVTKGEIKEGDIVKLM